MADPGSAPRTRLAPLLCLALAALVTGPGTGAQEGREAAPAPPLTLEAIQVTPPQPAADTLCRLTVTLGNGGDQIASQLGFTVRINGAELPVYRNQLYMFPVPPGERSELALYNFWSTETSRPMPQDGKLTVEVTLNEAQWMEIKDDEEGVEVWKPLGEVPGLPVSVSVTLEMAKE